MGEFLNVGDKIRCINDYSTATTKGNVYEISEVLKMPLTSTMTYYYVDDDGEDESMDTISHDSLPRFFEVIRNTTPGIEVGASDNVNHPSHYTQGGVEVIDIIAQITRGYSDGFHAYCVGNTLKYLARAPHKHAEIDEDVRKAAKYLEFIIDDKGAIK